MKNSSLLRRNAAALASVGIAAAPLMAFSGPAIAADACQVTEPLATEVSPTICEVSFSTAGDYTFTAPTGIAKLTAVAVGAGGGHVSYAGDYAGGGGEVIYISEVDISAPVEITVGASTDGSAPQAGSSFVNADEALGGFSGTYVDAATQYMGGGYSGNGNAGSEPDGVSGAGGGAGGAAPDGTTGGPGVTASEAAGDATLWPAVLGEPTYGAGGNSINLTARIDYAGAGAPNSGSFGTDGIVILRWDPTAKAAEPTLVDTGLTTWSIVLGAMLAGLFFFFASGSFSAKSRLQFAGSRERLVGLLRDADARLQRAENTDSDETKH